MSRIKATHEIRIKCVAQRQHIYFLYPFFGITLLWHHSQFSWALNIWAYSVHPKMGTDFIPKGEIKYILFTNYKSHQTISIYHVKFYKDNIRITILSVNKIVFKEGVL